jgi:hypothetical protein
MEVRTWESDFYTLSASCINGAQVGKDIAPDGGEASVKDDESGFVRI